MRKIFGAAAIACSLTTAVQAASFTDVYTSFYSFGDSLSDDGKFTQLDPPSFGGRFSNGLVWAEHIEDQFVAARRDTGNLALGGATAGDVNLRPSGPLSTFKGQVAVFANSLRTGLGLPTRVLPSVEVKSTGPQPGANPLLSVWFGANDIFQGFNPISAADAVADGIRLLNSIDKNVFDDFLVVALPDLGKTPAFAGADSAGATFASNLFNAQLARHLRALRIEGLNIVGFDPGTVVQQILDSIDAGTFNFGILDAENPCTLSVGAFLDPNVTNPGSCLDLGIDPDRLLFVDGVHPNAVAHKLFAEEVGRSIDANIAAVPVPATLPLMLVVLAGFGMIARRRSA
ncbi:SGNH/GDSL hydrolase family protein [uncultured Roseovarius sp.]|uniref:SGNH/GDSL hydrolase family protein n=1 Tax=uncultured Roseovarius sp. TaxID=293344 RepID=UPI002636A86F|nr:SGNH/GDSL hydrolase family protein [uncultured Roseovarius sp.]